MSKHREAPSVYFRGRKIESWSDLPTQEEYDMYPTGEPIYPIDNEKELRRVMAENNDLKHKVRVMREALEARPPVGNCNTPGYVDWNKKAEKALQ